MIWIKLSSNFNVMTLWHECSPVNLLHEQEDFCWAASDGNWFLWITPYIKSQAPTFIQKQPSRVVLWKKCAENMQQIYWRTPMPKSEITLQRGCSPVNLLHIFRIPFLKSTSGWLLLFIVTFLDHSYSILH